MESEDGVVRGKKFGQGRDNLAKVFGDGAVSVRFTDLALPFPVLSRSSTRFDAIYNYLYGLRVFLKLQLRLRTCDFENNFTEFHNPRLFG